MSAGLATASVVDRPAALRRAAPLLVLAVGAVALLLLFRAEMAAAVHVWASSTAYGHCFLVLPVAAWLAWERRDRLDGLAARPLPWAVSAALPLTGLWFAAERLGIMEARQLLVIALLLLLTAAVLGRPLWRAFAVPLLYLVFLVPFGGFLVAPLQAFTAHFIDVGLDVLRIPHVVTRFVIEIPEGDFRVAEACAGLRFLIASIAFGVVYACTLYRSPARRLGFMAAAVVVPVIANGLRALGIVVLGHALGSAQAAAVDHLLYGWVFFSIVILFLILAGLAFREDIRPPGTLAREAMPPILGSIASPTRTALVAGGVLLLAALGPSTSAALDRREAAEQAAMGQRVAVDVLARVKPPDGCSTTQTGTAWIEFACAGLRVRVTALAFAAGSSPAMLIAARRAAVGPAGAEDASVVDWTLASGRPDRWQVTQTVEPDQATAVCLWAGDRCADWVLQMRLDQALASILGGRRPTLLVSVSATGDQTSGPRAVSAGLRRFLSRTFVVVPDAVRPYATR